MGKLIKKGTRGNAANFMTRTQAVRRLQLSLKDFRRLCILKGVYPREPSNKFKGRDKVYYYTKDIMYIAREPILNKFRQQKALAKKIKRAAARRENEKVKRFRRNAPRYSLDHIVRERYPTFVDALRDLDDALSLIHLFSTLRRTGIIFESRINSCVRLSLEFQRYIQMSRSLRKAFVTVKGIYYQADIDGQKVTWVTPFKFVPVFPKDVDYRVMLTFLEFYETLLKFVNFRLYHSLNLNYPPAVDPLGRASAEGLSSLVLHAEGAGSGAVPTFSSAEEEHEYVRAQLEKKQAEAAKPVPVLNDMFTGDADADADAEADSDADSDADAEADSDSEAEADADAEGFDVKVENGDGDGDGGVVDVIGDARKAEAARELFRGLRFFVAREAPRDSLEFVIPAFGGVVSWEAVMDDDEVADNVPYYLRPRPAPYAEADTGITHHIVDRPSLARTYPGREYVQPQWVYDSINAGMLLPIEQYRPGMQLPPHLSPFEEEENGAAGASETGYVPLRKKYLDTLRRVRDGEAPADALRQFQSLPATIGGAMPVPVPESGMPHEVDADGEAVTAPVAAKKADEDADDVASEVDEESEEEEDVAVSKKKTKKKAAAAAEAEPEAESEEEAEEEESEDDGPQPDYSSESSEDEESDEEQGDDEAPAPRTLKRSRRPKYMPKDEKKRLGVAMMTKKRRRLYERIQHSNKQKEKEVTRLQSRAAKIGKKAKASTA